MPVPAPKLDDDCLILTGPTASGKTAVALQMAERLGADILSVDSVSVYRGLDIGSAKPTAAERARVPHHLVDLVEPEAPFSVADWLAAAAKAMADCRRRGRRILLVGGTPLYLRCLRDGLDELPPGDPAIRARLLAETEAKGSEPLYRRLRGLAPAMAATIHPHDTKRIVRGLEIAEVTGSLPDRSWGSSAAERPAAFPCPVLVLDLPRRLLAERIERRAEAMFAHGLLDETRAAVAAGGIGPTAAQAAGYAEALACLRGELTEAEAIARTARRTRQLAKRQRTWLRSFPDAVWISG
jgi:tRNA dimethylallyltransferase